MASSPVVLILGAGSNVGQHVARAFAAKNYKVALVARKLKEEESTPNQLHIPGDLSNPNAVVDAFTKVKEVFGHPSVVVYNGINSFKHFLVLQKLLTSSKLLLSRPMTPRTHSLCLWPTLLAISTSTLPVLLLLPSKLLRRLRACLTPTLRRSFTPAIF